MSSAKAKMREKKMRNQPASVQYPSSSHVESSKENGGRGDLHHHVTVDQPEFHPSSKRQRTSANRDGWLRGHQKDGGGYAREMPKFITAGAFARARAAEVSAMSKAVTKATGSSHVSQALPKHMRRRAMSHNTKRLPRRSRDVANRMREKSLQAGSKKKKEPAKSKSRKARRRHGNSSSEFNRRQRKNIWLETHIWHAKRFHMVKKWGYCLGDRPTYKCYRPCYRAMSSHCLLQDLSYYCCIELEGEEDNSSAASSQSTCKEAGPTFAATMCSSGGRQGSVTVYRAGQYPSHASGPVTYLWRPPTAGLTRRQSWIWAHPTLKQDSLSELRSVCQCSEAVAPPVEPEVSCAEAEAESKSGDIPDHKVNAGAKRKRSCKGAGEPAAKKILGDGTRLPGSPVTWKSSSTGILINDLTMEIVRYRSIGPQSHSVSAETLEAASVCNESQSSFWWPQHCKDQSNMNLHQQQTDVFNISKGICSTGELPPGTVSGLTVDDPRLTLPKKKVKAVPCVNQAQEADEEKRRQSMLRGVPQHCSQSFSWERSVRDNVTDNKISEQESNRMRSESSVPGSRSSPTPPQGRVPILSVHQPGKQSGNELNSWGAGWDLLLPKGWGMAFWIPSVYRGVRVAGSHMSSKHSQNKAAPHFPHDYPDCPAGARFQEEQEAEFSDKFRRRPPAKRTNYIKHGCSAPFRCPWQQSAEEWELSMTEGGAERKGDGKTERSTETHVMMEEVTSAQNIAAIDPVSRFSVLRNRKSSRLLSGWCRPMTSKAQRQYRGAPPGPPLNHSALTSFHTAHRMSSVWVRSTSSSKGKPEAHAMVCVPTPDDSKSFGKDKASSGPQEPSHKDHFKCRINRKKGPKKAAPSLLSSGDHEGKVSDAPSDSDPTTSKDPESSSDLTLGLWPDPSPSVTSHCSRVTLGWVSQGDFSSSVGCGEALGFVSVTGLLHTLLNQPAEHRGKSSSRNPSSSHYRFVQLHIDV